VKWIFRPKNVSFKKIDYNQQFPLIKENINGGLICDVLNSKKRNNFF